MATRRNHLKLNTVLSLSDPTGKLHKLYARELLVVRRAETVTECRLTVDIEPEVLEEFIDQNLFALTRLNVPLGTPDVYLGTDNICTLELDLDSEQIPVLLALGEDDASRAAALQSLAAEPQPPLGASDSWHAHAVYSRANGARHGFRVHTPATDETADTDSFMGLAEALAELEDLTVAAMQKSRHTLAAEQDSEEFDDDAEDDAEDLEDGDDLLSLSSLLEIADIEALGITAAVVLTVFEEDGWPCEIQADPPLLTTTYRGEHGDWECTGHFQDDPAIFIFYSVAWFSVPTARTPAVMEYITRANQELIYGNFELDLDTGRLRFKTVAAFDAAPFMPDAVRPVLYGNVDTMDHYLPGLIAVVYGGKPPAHALADLTP